MHAIEQELQRLWRTAAEPVEGESQLPVLRACALNLVVYSADPGRISEIEAVIPQLIPEHPLRAIVMSVDESGGESRVDAWISAHCVQPVPEGKQICCEQIRLDVRGEPISGLSRLVVPILVPDVPVFLWWCGAPPLGSERLEDFLGIADRVIFDSTELENPSVDFPRLARLIVSREANSAFSDVVWIRLTFWRHVVARLFDSPLTRPSLSRLKRVVIGYAEERDAYAPSSQALLMAGWLASRLMWQPLKKLTFSPMQPEEARSELHLRSPGEHPTGARTVTIEFRALRFPSVPRGELVSLELDAEGTPATRFIVAQTGEPSWVESRVEWAGMNPIVQRIGRPETSLAQDVGSALELFGHDRVYEQAVKMAAAFLDEG
uniref:Hypothetical conserved protein n=1 Tax=uncultured Acidobacteriota bacterium TaxID=171953 RepID=H5SG46_9BACT|nr:hypothetical conserved protein [uncultured Acidobacteriota bacterium]